MWLPIAFLLVAGTLILGPYVAWKLWAHRRLLEGWRQWAAENRYEFVASSGSFPRATGQRVRGSRGPIQFELETCSQGGAESRRVFTRLLAKGPELVSTPLDLLERSWLTSLNSLLLKDWIELDDSLLTQHWRVRGKRMDEARSMLTGDFRRCLLACDHVECVSIDGGEVEIRFDGEISEGRVLDLAVEFACAAWPKAGARERLAS